MTNNTNQPDDTDETPTAMKDGYDDGYDKGRRMAIRDAHPDIDTVELPEPVYARMVNALEVFEVDYHDDAIDCVLDVSDFADGSTDRLEKFMRLAQDLEDGRYD